MAYGYKSNECEIMIKGITNIKEEYKPGGKNRQYILDKVGLTETEYLECLNRATNGGVVREAFK